MLGGLPVSNWFMEYRRMALVEHHNTCAGLVFVRVLYEISQTSDVIPCSALMRKTVSKYKGKNFLIQFSPLLKCNMLPPVTF